MTAVRLMTTAETPAVGMPDRPPIVSVVVEPFASGWFVPILRVSRKRVGVMP